MTAVAEARAAEKRSRERRLKVPPLASVVLLQHRARGGRHAGTHRLVQRPAQRRERVFRKSAPGAYLARKVRRQHKIAGTLDLEPPDLLGQPRKLLDQFTGFLTSVVERPAALVELLALAGHRLVAVPVECGVQPVAHGLTALVQPMQRAVQGEHGTYTLRG